MGTGPARLALSIAQGGDRVAALEARVAALEAAARPAWPRTGADDVAEAKRTLLRVLGLSPESWASAPLAALAHAVEQHVLELGQ